MNLDNTHTLLMLLATTLGGGIGVHLAANLIKKFFKLNSSSAIHTMVVALAAVAAGAQYIQQIHSSIPPVVLGISGPAIYGFSQIIYRYANYTSDFMDKVRSYNASIAAPASDAPSTTSMSVSAPLPSVTSTSASSEPTPASF